jgi:hypothetical protein
MSCASKHSQIQSFETSADKADRMRLMHKKKSGFRCSGRRFNQMRSLMLEGEIHAGSDHAEVVVWTVDKVPAEITDPANVRRKANF